VSVSGQPERRWPVLAAFLVLVVGGGLAIGYATAPGEWYAGLAKPSFNPPDWLFAPVWTILYVLIAIAGWRIFARPDAGAAKLLWVLQLALNFLWSPTFFGAESIGGALAVIVVLLAAVLGFIALSWRSDRVAALLFAPYAAWVAFATLLNGSIFALN
jgi:tryptophan-rich sensory protein